MQPILPTVHPTTEPGNQQAEKRSLVRRIQDNLDSETLHNLDPRRIASATHSASRSDLVLSTRVLRHHRYQMDALYLITLVDSRPFER